MVRVALPRLVKFQYTTAQHARVNVVPRRGVHGSPQDLQTSLQWWRQLRHFQDPNNIRLLKLRYWYS